MRPLKPSTDGLAVHGLERHRTRSFSVDAPTLLVGIESALAEVVVGRQRHLLDRGSCVLVPRGTRVALRAVAPASRVALIAFAEATFAAVARSYRKLGLDRERLRRVEARLEVLPRTVWVHEIVHRYQFERLALGVVANATTRFLETELLKEIAFLLRDRDEGADRAAVVRRHGPVVTRAIAFVESHLFEAPKMKSILRVAGASESTLLRAFERELGATPIAFWRDRKLDEALGLLRSGSLSVAEVALHVGYENPTAFAFAFRRRFGKPPSAFRPRGPARAAP